MDNCPWSNGGTCDVTKHHCVEPKRCAAMLNQWRKKNHEGMSKGQFRIWWNKKNNKIITVLPSSFHPLQKLEYQPLEQFKRERLRLMLTNGNSLLSIDK